MRYVFFVLMCLMLLFMGVQFNDPDGLMWMAIYAVPAAWCAVAVFWQKGLSYSHTKVLLLLSILASLVGVVWFWPLHPEFWTREVWYNVETAREGMGLMIIAGVLALIFFHAARKNRANGAR